MRLQPSISPRAFSSLPAPQPNFHAIGNYVDRKDRTIHTNTVEGAFSIFKRGMKGVYQHCGEQHLHRYLAEFEFRYNNRIATALMTSSVPAIRWLASVGERLTYARPDERARPKGKVGRRHSR